MVSDISINTNLAPLTKFSNINRRTGFKDTLSWNITQMITSQYRSSQHKNRHEKWDQKLPPLLSLKKSQWKFRNNMIRISQWRESHCRKNTWVEKRSQKTRAVRVIIRYLSRKVNHHSKVVWEKKTKRVYQVYQFRQNRLTSSLDNSKVSKDTTSAYGLIEIYVT